MRVECAWCKKDLGEKCPNCSSRNYLYAVADRWHAECLDCGKIFALGVGAVSSTICETCRPKVVPILRERLTEDEIVLVASAARRAP
ncbi:MAG: hypothetical protein ACYDAL_16335 [Candidatus Dormibacteraceae bacterium]